MKGFSFILTVSIFIVAGQAALWDCEINEDCGGTATCISGICTCSKGEGYSVEKRACFSLVKVYGESCEDDVQCSYLQGLCSGNICVCAEKAHYIRGRCVKTSELEGDCENDDQCYNGYDAHANVCKDKKCTCRDGYERRGTYDCRHMATAIGEECGVDFDCKNIVNATCQSLHCKISSKSESISKNDVVIHNIKKSNFETKLYEPCTANTDCIGENVYCSSIFGECMCKHGFADMDGTCKAELGTPFQADAPTCTHLYSKAVYKDGACYCLGMFGVNTENLRTCKKLAVHNTFACTTTESCRIFGPNSICKDKKCTCEFGYLMNQDNWCIKQTCSSNDDCVAVEHSSCSLTEGVCKCNENFVLDNGKCFPQLNGECTVTEDCKIVQNSICNGTVCICDEENNFVVDGKGGCVKVTPLYDECIDTSECIQLDENAECISNICNCKDGYFDINGICHPKKKFGDFCSTLKQCTESLNKLAICENSICKCPPGYEINRETNCIPSSSTKLTSSFLFVSAILLVLWK